MVSKKITLKIGNLKLNVQTKSQGFLFDMPECHRKFSLMEGTASDSGDYSMPTLNLLTEDLLSKPEWKIQKLLCKNEIWELWSDNENHLIFTQPSQVPQRWVRINPEFTAGTIQMKYSEINSSIYPLQYIDIVIFSNWLANLGDIILHASGIAIDGQGYCFIGDSGSGKSTLVGDLAHTSGLTILGEDQIILRYINGKFWIFGTPWHESANRCSPTAVPLSRLFLLDRSGSQPIEEVSGFHGTVQILKTCFYPVYRSEVMENILSHLSLLAESIKFYRLTYLRGQKILSEIVGN